MLDIDTIAATLRLRFPDLQVAVDDGDQETHLPFLVLQRPDRTPIAVVSETIDGRWRCCDVASARLTRVQTLPEVVGCAHDAIQSRRRLDEGK